MAAAAELPPALQRYLEHLRVERRLAPRSVQMIHDALVRLQASAVDAGIELTEVQPMHVRRWAAQLRERRLASRSIAIHLSAWRGLYRWWGREGVVRLNPVEGVRAPKAPKPLPKALSVEQAVALASHQPQGGNPVLQARDHCMVELLYGCGLRVAELVGLDQRASAEAAGWIEAARLSGNGDARILAMHLFPNSLPPAMVQVSLNMGWAILNAAGLSFIGLGVRPPTPEWGILVAEGAQFIVSGEWWVSLFPGLVLMLAVFTFNLLGDALRDIFDPRRRT